MEDIITIFHNILNSSFGWLVFLRQVPGAKGMWHVPQYNILIASSGLTSKNQQFYHAALVLLGENSWYYGWQLSDTVCKYI